MRAPALISLVILLSGCAGTAAGGAGDRDANRITRQEILDANAANLWEVVNNLRPRWLQVTNMPSMSGGSAQILVYRDNVRLAGPDALRGMNPELAQEIRWLDRMEASSRFPRSGGGGEVAGAIVVITRSP
jgi:hypothetical protein